MTRGCRCHGDTSVNRRRKRRNGQVIFSQEATTSPTLLVDTMTEQGRTMENKMGKCMLHNWVEERAVAALDTAKEKNQIQRHGHTGIITLNQEAKMEHTTTLQTAFAPPKRPGVRTKGVRRELLEKHIAQMIREEMKAELDQPVDLTEFSSTTQRDFNAQGFLPLPLQSTKEHGDDYKSEQAVTFWSENYQRIQGVSAAPTSRAPFKKSAQFSTPIGERLEDPELPPDS